MARYLKAAVRGHLGYQSAFSALALRWMVPQSGEVALDIEEGDLLPLFSACLKRSLAMISLASMTRGAEP